MHLVFGFLFYFFISSVTRICGILMMAGIESAILSTCIELSELSKSESELEVVSSILTLIILLLLIFFP